MAKQRPIKPKTLLSKNPTEAQRLAHYSKMLDYWIDEAKWQVARIKEIRMAFADYADAEGCGCCRNQEGQDAASRKLSPLLDIPMFGDSSRLDFYKFKSMKAPND